MGWLPLVCLILILSSPTILATLDEMISGGGTGWSG